MVIILNQLLNGDVAIVTGSADGIGKGIAKKLLETGASVLLVDINGQKLQETYKTFVQEFGEGKVRTFQADLRESNVKKKIVALCTDGFSKIDILINCAGIYPSTPTLNISDDEWDLVFDLNVKGAFFLTQAVIQQMLKQGAGGRIVNVTSTASEVARPGVAHYCASKAALKMQTQVLALEFAPYGIRVNALGPGLVETETLLQTLTTEKAIKEHKEKLSYSPMRRAALVEEIADGVLYLVSIQSSYVTGQTILVDGGYSAGRVYKSMQ
jgi:NAD(P)-dependent dehydrogenase (short-subunit alcohol dehydrogenase family)